MTNDKEEGYIKSMPPIGGKKTRVWMVLDLDDVCWKMKKVGRFGGFK